MKKGKKPGIVLGIVTAGLLCVGVGTTVARYYSKRNGALQVSVARFDVSVEVAKEQSDTLVLSPKEGETTYSFSVTSNSDVALSYDVVLTLPKQPTNGLSFSINGVAPTVEGLVYVFPRVGVFSERGTNTHTITVTASDLSTDWSFENVKVQIVVEQWVG